MRNTLMVLGVVEIEDDVLQLGAAPLEYNRTPEYTEFLKEIFEDLQYVHQTKRPVYLLAASGTGMMEAAACNVLSRGDTALYVNGGVFGARWGLICKQHGVNTVEIKLDFGVSVNPEEIRKALDANPAIKAVFLTQNETSTGTKTDIEAIAKIVREYPNTITVVDAISAITVEDMQFDNWGVDVLVTTGNKALAVPPGVGFMTFSEKAFEMAKKSDLRLLNSDVLEYDREYKRVSTPYTPPISLLKQLGLRLKKIRKEGLENLRKRYEKNTLQLRSGCEKLGLTFFAKNQATCVTGLLMPEGIDAMDVLNKMKKEHHIELAPSWPELKSKLIRVGNFGNINEPEIDKFLSALKSSLKDLGYDRQ